MKIAIIGAGFTGLAAGLKLQKAGHRVTIFEKESNPGGLAIGFKNPKWKWSLEKNYHHWFTNDKSVLSLAKKLKYEILIIRPKTSVYINNKIYKFDSLYDVLKFPEINLYQRLRMGIAIALLRYNPFWKSLEKYRVSDLLPKMMGEKPYEVLWKPLIIKKFGQFANNISLAWFWARIVKRTPSLVYPKGGFLEFINAIISAIKKNGGKVVLDTEIKNIDVQKDAKIKINHLTFDKVIVTLPSPLFTQITPQLPNDYRQKLLALKEIGAINLILHLKKPFFQDGTYWLNICDTKYPITGIIEHTNFINKKYYNNEHLIYVLNYLSRGHRLMKMDKKELLRVYDPILSRINKQYKREIIDIEYFISPFAQPVIPTYYSKIKPPFETPLKNVYLANIQQVYPWDRGTNYAVELGEKVADSILKS